MSPILISGAFGAGALGALGIAIHRSTLPRAPLDARSVACYSMEWDPASCRTRRRGLRGARNGRVLVRASAFDAGVGAESADGPSELAATATRRGTARARGPQRRRSTAGQV